MAPLNQLRRRPGGDLKAADHVHDLEPAPRPVTGDSWATYSTSSGLRSHHLSGTHFSGQGPSGFVFPPFSSISRQRESLVLLQTHSSQPNMRPSFEKQVSHLAALTDQPSAGGIEDALAKLEGKTSPTATDSTAVDNIFVGTDVNVLI